MDKDQDVLQLIAGVVIANVLLIPGAIASKEIHLRLVKPAVDAILDNMFNTK